jgi:putative endonuclease
MFYIYILKSLSSNIYYVGYTSNYQKRFVEHNTSDLNTFTSKHRPWKLKAVFECGPMEKEAIHTERFIKKQKSRKLIEQLCDVNFIPTGVLSELVRVPDIRD